MSAIEHESMKSGSSTRSEFRHQVQRVMLSGKRLHLQYGPINLVIKAHGTDRSVQRAYDCAEQRLQGLLAGLAADLKTLRLGDVNVDNNVREPAARRMIESARLFAERFSTPMISVAGAVADEILVSIKNSDQLEKVYVNNGGDIAIWMAEANMLNIGIVSSLSEPTPNVSVRVSRSDGIGGVATSGWPGHSMSLGIADAVTVLASNAATADAAATLIANEVDCHYPGIDRCPANSLDPDSDLGELLVTTGVAKLPSGIVCKALNRGERLAEKWVMQKKIKAVFMHLQGRRRVVGPSLGRLNFEGYS